MVVMRFIHAIKSTGTQYIDTGFAPNGNTRVSIAFLTTQSYLSAGILAADQAWKSNGLGVFVGHLEYGSNNTAHSFNDGIKHTVSVNENGDFYKDGALIFEGQDVSFQSPCSLTLFCLNRNGTKQDFFEGTVYYRQICDNGVLAEDLWPCIDDNGVVCMYDKVNSAYHYNAGTGEFEAGYAHVFMPRIFEPPVIAEPIAVTITRTYSSSDRPIVVNGTSYTSAGTASATVLAGDVISFTIGGLTVTDYLVINGTDVAHVVSGADRQTYKWIVPDGISSITIEDSGRKITVTTS